MVYCKLSDIITTSAYIFNPGTGQPEQYYDAYNVVPGDWVASDSTGYTWRIDEIYNVKRLEQGWLLEGNTKQDLRKVISKLAQEKGWLIITLRHEKKSLESVFKELTKN